ncbi:MAG: GNAT family N-acetyltransferase [Treponema sp.]|nr:GNAT family N-acetyltransferase [Treponema sp.]
MQFDLDEALIDQILFAMEDQDGDFLLDTQEGIVHTLEEIEEAGEDSENEDRYIPLPNWSSNDGFRLMEKFTAGLKNPPVKNELTHALDRGRGVFRAFKDTLSQYPEVEKLWYSFKEREMRRTVLDWYNALREEWGLERIGEEPEDTEDLVLEDFRFRPGTTEDTEAAKDLHRSCIAELETNFERNQGGPIPAFLLSGSQQDWHFPASMSLVAETSRGDFAGYISAHQYENLLSIEALEVYTEYRGLGLAEALLTRLFEMVQQQKRDIRYLQIALPAQFEGFSRVLHRTGFQVYESRYLCRLNKALE